MGKLLREDIVGRGRDWPSYPTNLCPLYPSDTSTSVVCALCKSPRDGLRYDPVLEQFVHADKRNCVPGHASSR